MKALINVDYTYDFVAPDGALSCGVPGQAIEKRITELTKKFHNDGDFVVFAIDSHDPKDKFHPENKLFPPHNKDDSLGQELYGSLKELYKSIDGSENLWYTKKSRYSAFCGTELLLKLRERRIDEVHIVGVCTDICVLHTAVDAYNLGFSIVIHEDAVASFNPQGHEWALNHFKNCLGAEVIKGY
ncbi:MAG: cysteine hydrolase family protein [Eubacteriales bacterium]|nr:cysteine hydrolase family protein [Eubacteriales bacterium]